MTKAVEAVFEYGSNIDRTREVFESGESQTEPFGVRCIRRRVKALCNKQEGTYEALNSYYGSMEIPIVSKSVKGLCES